MDHQTYYNIISDSQHGLRARRSCETQLVVTLAKAQSEGKPIDAILLDFSKAVDKVPHNRILLKLDHYGIREILCNGYVTLLQTALSRYF